MNKHTTGPWAKHGGVIRSLGVNDRKVADVRVLDDEGQANANLIAAAPDLLEALEKCVTRFEANLDDEKDMGRGSMTYLLETCSSAIARARGQS